MLQVGEVVRVILVKVEAKDVLCTVDGGKGFPKRRTDGGILWLIGVVCGVPVINDAFSLVAVIVDVVPGIQSRELILPSLTACCRLCVRFVARCR